MIKNHPGSGENHHIFNRDYQISVTLFSDKVKISIGEWSHGTMATLDIFQRNISEPAPAERRMNEVNIHIKRGFGVEGRKQGYSNITDWFF